MTTSTRVKKKKAKAARRNEARYAVNRIEAAEETTAGAKEPRPELVESDEKPAKFVEARFAKVGQKLVNWSRNWVVEYTGKTRQKPGGFASSTVPGEGIEYMFTGWDAQGHETGEFGFISFYPLREDATDVARIMEKFYYKKAIEDRKMGKAIERHERAAGKAAEGGEVDETGEAGGSSPQPRKARAPRGDVDPKTGCTPGSDGHAFGEIMLSIPVGPGHRKAAVEKITEILKQRMEEKKAKALSQSWISTLFRKAPEIYGKYKTAVAA